MSIQWFPGHMSSTLKMINAEIKLCDVIIYILDARCPISSINPKFDQLLGRRPVLFVLNKCDLAPESVTSLQLPVSSLGNKKDYRTVSLNSTLSGSTKIVLSALNNLLKDKIQSSNAKGITRTLRAMVIGVPNSGKSTFINNLVGKGKTITGDKPGVTRAKQWLSVNTEYSMQNAGFSLWLLDTPGTLWPAFTNEQVARNLAYVGSIKDDVLNIVDLAKNLLTDLIKLDSNCIKNRFQIEFPSNLEGCSQGGVFDLICRKRGYILKGNIINEERAAKAILTEFRAGKLGKFNLDLLLAE